MSSTSASHKVAHSPELISQIFLYISSKINFQKNRSVCKLWFEEVLNVELRDLDDCRQLLRLLAPMEEETVSTGPGRRNQRKRFVFERPILPEDWLRFDKYAVKVRKLTISNLSAHEEVTRDMTLCRLRMDWLPNLHTLTCTVDDAILQLFAQPSVTTLQLEDFNKGSVSSPALSYLPVRMPALQRLSISGDFSRSDLIKNPEISTALQAVFSSMKELKYITLPQSLTLPSIVRPISTLPALTTLRVLFSRRDSTSAMELFDESLTPNSFSTLLDLDFHMPLLLATSQLTSQVRYKKLSRLVLTAHSATYPLNGDPAGTIDDLEELIQAISASCPMLEDFTLRSWSRDYYEEPENSGGFQVFTPITACHHLKALRLHYHWDISVIDTDLLFLLSSLPQLTILYFMGTFHGEPDLHISVLSKIAVKYPSKLEELGLSVSTNPEQLPKTDEKINFIGLKKLSLTTSRITNDLAVAEYLSLLLSDDCHLDHMQGRWDKVKSYLPTLRRMLRYGGSRACSKCAS